jgi:hypothetical protein
LTPEQLAKCKKKAGNNIRYNLTLECSTKLVFKEHIKRKLSEKMQSWLSLKANEDATNEKQMEGQFNIVHEIKMKKKVFLVRLLPLLDLSLEADFVLEVKKNWDVTNPSNMTLEKLQHV